MWWVLLVLLGVLCIGVGQSVLTQATMGVGIIGIGCFLAILARLVQAAKYQGEPEMRARRAVEQEIKAIQSNESRRG